MTDCLSLVGNAVVATVFVGVDRGVKVHVFDEKGCKGAISVFSTGIARTVPSRPFVLALIGTSLGVVLAPASLIGGSLFKGKE